MTDKIYVLMETTADSPTEPGIPHVLMAFENRFNADTMAQSLRKGANKIEQTTGIHVSVSYYITETKLVHHQS